MPVLRLRKIPAGSPDAHRTELTSMITSALEPAGPDNRPSHQRHHRHRLVTIPSTAHHQLHQPADRRPTDHTMRPPNNYQRHRLRKKCEYRHVHTARYIMHLHITVMQFTMQMSTYMDKHKHHQPNKEMKCTYVDCSKYMYDPLRPDRPVSPYCPVCSTSVVAMSFPRGRFWPTDRSQRT